MSWGGDAVAGVAGVCPAGKDGRDHLTVLVHGGSAGVAGPDVDGGSWLRYVRQGRCYTRRWRSPAASPPVRPGRMSSGPFSG